MAMKCTSIQLSEEVIRQLSTLVGVGRPFPESTSRALLIRLAVDEFLTKYAAAIQPQLDTPAQPAATEAVHA